jgi:hypothetical protein
MSDEELAAIVRMEFSPMPGQISPAQHAAAEELLKRRSVRKSLVEWARHKGFEPAKHHLLIINEIEAFLQSDDEVLLLFAPPGSAKSTYVSILLPSWYLANNPTHSILTATHSVEFAEGGDAVFGTISHLIPKFLASNSPQIARLQHDGTLTAALRQRLSRSSFLPTHEREMTLDLTAAAS